MADKKMTDLADLGSAIAQDDIFHVVDDPNGSPINKQVSVTNLFGNLKYVTSDSGGDTDGREFLKANLTVGTTSSTTGDTTAFASYVTHERDTGESAVEVQNIYGAKTKLTVTGATTIATGVVAGQYVNLDLTNEAGNEATFTGSVYGLVVDITDSNATDRKKRPDAFISLKDSYVTADGFSDGADGFNQNQIEDALTYSVTHLMDIGGSATGMVHLTSNANGWGSGEGLAISANGGFDATAETKIRIKVNGTDYFLLATANGYYET